MKAWTVIACLACLAALTALAETRKPFPARWGAPPELQTSDYRELPGGFGHGSSTLAMWIETNLARDLAAAGATGAAPLFACDFTALPVGPLPDSFMVLNGGFAVKDSGANRVMALPGAPPGGFSVLFGPVTNAGVSVSAKVFGTATGRRQPVFGVGLGGAAGHKLRVAPGRQAVELILGETLVVTNTPFQWVSGQWTRLKLQVRSTGGNAWRIEAKAWPADSPEPAEWLLTRETREPPPPGRASVLGSPFGTPIWFDDLKVERAW